jgi:hypothetical protein
VNELKARIATLEHQLSSLKESSVAIGDHHHQQASPTLIGDDSMLDEYIDPAVLQYDNSFDEYGGHDTGYAPLNPRGRSGSNLSSMNDPGQFNAFSNGGLALALEYAMDTIPNPGTYRSNFDQTPDNQGFDAILGQSDPSLDVDVNFGLELDLDLSPNASNSPLASSTQIASPAPDTAAMASPTSTRLTCMDCGKVFKRQRDLQRHRRSHDPTARRFSCPYQGCDRVGTKGFLRRDKLVEHCRNYGH